MPYAAVCGSMLHAVLLGCMPQYATLLLLRPSGVQVQGEAANYKFIIASCTDSKSIRRSDLMTIVDLLVLVELLELKIFIEAFVTVCLDLERALTVGQQT